MEENNKKPNISQWIANAIADTGCRVVYGGHGGALVPLVNAVVEHPLLKWVCARNEHDAATMAAAHAKYTGNLGVVIATSGPGASNLTTGLMEALMDSVPLLAITGMKPRVQLGYAEFQDIDQSKLFAGAGIEWSKSASSPEAAIPLLRDAVSIALSRRTCAHLAIPVDIQAAESPLPLKAFCAAYAHKRVQNAQTINHKALDDAAHYLVGPQDEAHPRTILCAGLRALDLTDTNRKPDEMSRVLLDLAEALNAPILTRLHAKGIVDETHPLSFGVVGVHGKPGLEAAATLISSAERVICIGVEDETLLVCNMAGLQIRDMVEIQPDSFAVSTRFHAEHTLLGDVKQTCTLLTEKIGALSWKREKHRAIRSAQAKFARSKRTSQGLSRYFDEYDHYELLMVQSNPLAPPSYHAEISNRSDIDEAKINIYKNQSDKLWNDLHQGKWREVLGDSGDLRFHPHCPAQEGGENYCHPAKVLVALSRARENELMSEISRKATIAIDVGDVTLWSSLCLCLKGGSRTLYSERLGTMGYALCAGIAAVFADPEPSGAVVLTGDGGFQMTLQELAAFQQDKKPGDRLLVIVFDNQVLGRVAFGFENSLGCDLLGPDYVALAKAYGGDGVRLDCNDKAEETVQMAMEMDGLFLIHVIVDPNVKADMASFKDTSIVLMNSG